ncbi:MAG: hypothetical protein JSV97_01270 [candidate division WOR-3 bacterium]|nr:MAG: hypothetical protein JSV97_01270 [candidate division WOR-3 bacterium]
MNLCVLLVLFETLTFSPHPDSTIRGVYINPYQAGNKEYLNRVFAKADSGLINTIVVDFKSDYGFLAYASNVALAKKLWAIKRFIDIDNVIERAARHNVKLVARIVCFRDDYLSQDKKYAILDDSGEIWYDNKGIAWTNPYQEKVGDYLIDITKELVERGITSVAYDYIRFPSDGEVWRIRLTKVMGKRYEPIITFLKKVRNAVDVEIGVCVFGFAVWQQLKAEGQDIEKMADYIDVLYPMLYPSHFGWNFKREVNEYWRNYWIYFDSVQEAFDKLPGYIKVVPFVQGFEFGADTFNSDYVFSQIHGASAAHAHGFIVWHAGGDYTISWPALSWAHNAVLKQSALMSLNSRMKARGQRYQLPNPHQ